jgi:hypothetical protein
MLSMKTKFNLLLALFTICLFESKSYAQHQISIQPVAFSFFFDSSPIRTNLFVYTPSRAYGLQYQYQKPNNKLISAQYNIIEEFNEWYDESSNLQCTRRRTIKEVNVVFSSQKQLINKVYWTYGAGPTVRSHNYIFTTWDGIIQPMNVAEYQSNQLQLGAKGLTAINYTPFKWITLYSQLNFSGYLLGKPIFRNNNTDFINDFVGNKPFNFPSRLYSSLTFGVGINF